MNDIEHTGRHAGLQGELRQQHRRHRILFRGFEDERIAADNGHRKHPQRDHGWKIERRDTGAHAEWLVNRVRVDAARDIFREFAQLQGADRTSVFYDLEPAEYIAFGVREGFTLFGAQGLGNPAHVFANQRLQLEHDTRASRDRCVLPGLERGFGGGHRGIDFRIARKRDLGKHLLRGRIDHIVPFGSLRFNEFAIEQHLDGRRGRLKSLRLGCHLASP